MFQTKTSSKAIAAKLSVSGNELDHSGQIRIDKFIFGLNQVEAWDTRYLGSFLAN